MPDSLASKVEPLNPSGEIHRHFAIATTLLDFVASSRPLAAVLLATLVLCPVGEGWSHAKAADKPAAQAGDRSEDTPRPVQRRPRNRAADQVPDNSPPVLSGRITGANGEPVTDAEVTLSGVGIGGHFQTKTDDQGRYQFPKITSAGEHRLQIKSTRWIGIEIWNKTPVVNLSQESSITRDFELKRACQVVIRAVDEDGNPVRSVGLMAANLADEGHYAPESVYTDKEGLARLGGFETSPVKYVLGSMHDDYASEYLMLLLDNPEEVATHELVLRKGREVQGKAVCSDGNPPAGWRIKALPTWWHYGRSPMGTLIQPDGSFTLSHIVPGTYNVSIGIPTGDSGGIMVKPVLTAKDLLEAPAPLEVTLDHPSPASLFPIQGKIRFVGEMEHAFWVFATSIDGKYHASDAIRPGKTEFKLGPVPKGLYNIEFQHAELESKSLKNISIPSDDLEVELVVRGAMELRGTVVRAADHSPVRDFKLRIAKQRSLRGPNYAEDGSWRAFQNDKGEFNTRITGPGVFQVTATADGFGATDSTPINTDENKGEPIVLALKPGVSFSGRIVDEQGNPIDGVTIMPLSKAEWTSERSISFPPGSGTQTVDGEFSLHQLSTGQDTFALTHPDYCFGTEEVTISPETAEPLVFTLKKGGTIRGRVYGADGIPAPNVTLIFEDEHGSSRLFNEGKLATVVTDDNGEYQVEHLPERICTVKRADEWQAQGVVRHSVLTGNGSISTLNLGGRAAVKGRLLVNGVPLANRSVILGDNPNFGIFKAVSQTDADGSFTFRGIAPGVRTLFYDTTERPGDWVAIRDFEFTSKPAGLGEINHIEGTLAVTVEPATLSPECQITLVEFDPIWTFSNNSRSPVPKTDGPAPFLIQHVPLGKYELVVSHRTESRTIERRQIVHVTPENLNQQLTVQAPVGTASMSGQIDSEIFRPNKYGFLKLWNSDQTVRAYIAADPRAIYRLTDIPAGEYRVCDKDTRDAPTLATVSLREGEEKQIDFTPSTVTSSQKRTGYITVRVLTPEGIPLPCEIHLESPAGEVSRHSYQFAATSFMAEPGEYTLRIDYAGFESVRKTVELKPVNPDGRPEPGFDVRIRLQPSK